jgi:hypothetical protein
MSDTDTADVIDALNGSLGEVSMHATADEIVAAGRTRRRRRRLAGVATGIAGVSALALAITYGHPSTAPGVSAGGGAVAGVHIHEAAYTVDSQSDGTVRVTWDKSRYFTDHTGLEAALHQAGFRVTMRVGEFCTGAGDDASLNSSGIGPGVDKVMKGESANDGKQVTFVFTPSAMPAGKQLFIGYLTDAQRAARHDGVGSVERLVSATGQLTCTTATPPDAGPRDGAGTTRDSAPAKGAQK